MRSNVVAEGESGSEVALEVLNGLDVLGQLGVDGLLHDLELGSPLGLGDLAFLNSLHSDVGGVLELVLGESLGFLEEGVIDVDGDASEGHLGGGGDDVGGVDSAKGDTGDGVGAGD